MRWVYVPRIKGWVREHDPLTESGLIPKAQENPPKNPRKKLTYSEKAR